MWRFETSEPFNHGKKICYLKFRKTRHISLITWIYVIQRYLLNIFHVVKRNKCILVFQHIPHVRILTKFCMGINNIFVCSYTVWMCMYYIHVSKWICFLFKYQLLLITRSRVFVLPCYSSSVRTNKSVYRGVLG